MSGGFLADHKETVVGILLALAAFAVFGHGLTNDFVSYDDDKYVTANPNIRTGLNSESVRWAFTTSQASNWHPLTWVSHILDYSLWSSNPFGHHLTSLILHIASTLLLLHVLFRMTGFFWRSAFTAALFALHPLHVESVAWVSERKDVLSAFFWMLTMLAYVAYVKRPGIARYSLVALVYVLGVLSKPMVVTLPFVLLLLDYWPLGRLYPNDKLKPGGFRTSGKLVLEKIPLLLLAAASSVITYVVQQQGGAVAAEKLPFVLRAMNAPVAYVAYITRMIWPQDLAVFYPHPGSGLPAWEVVGSLLFLVLVTVLVIKTAPKAPYLATGWFWYLGTLVPVIGLVQVGLQAMADRYTYIPLIGPFIMIAWGVPEMMQRKSADPGPGVKKSKKQKSQPSQAANAGTTYAALGVLAILAIVAWVQVGYWKDSSALFEHALNATQDNYVAHLAVGVALAGRGDSNQAMVHYREALRIKPDYALARFNLGFALQQLKKTTEAIEQFNAGLKVSPNDANAHLALAMALEEENKFAESAAHYRTAIELDPARAETHLGLGVVLSRLSQNDEAIDEYRNALRIKPDFGLAHNNLALALYSEGDYAEAWKEIHLAQRHGYTPERLLLDALSQKLPEPQE